MPTPCRICVARRARPRGGGAACAPAQPRTRARPTRRPQRAARQRVPRAPPSSGPRPAGAPPPRPAAPRRAPRGSRTASDRARIETRGRWSRSASQQAPIVASSETSPSEWSLSASASTRNRAVVERQHALVAKLEGERLRPSSVPRIDRLVLASGVVQEPEAEDERAIDVAERRCRARGRWRRRTASAPRRARPSRAATPVGARSRRGASVTALPCLHHRTLGRRLRRRQRGRPRRHGAARRSARAHRPRSSPCRRNQQPTTVPVRPIPPQQWT